jgi:beta-aspartyl-peptidase (threonine type)
MKPAIVVHGGAGSWDLTTNRLHRARIDCVNAAAAGQAALLGGGSAIEAVETAVRVLEDSPFLDAGRGSYLNAAGQIEMDALIMDGATLNLGAIAAVQRVLNPISLARLVMTESKHNFLVASGAEKFADEIGFPRCDISDLLVEHQLEIFEKLQQGTATQTSQTLSDKDGQHGDTVGAVALDIDGNVAAATSTGGTKRKHPGRVGDSPLVGSGAYADNWTGAASATGHGEDLMRVLVSKRVCDFIAEGLSAQKSCEAAIDVLADRVDGHGGLIAVDVRGRIGVFFNTGAMPHAHAIADEKIVSGY